MEVSIANEQEESIRFLPETDRAVVTKLSPFSRVMHRATVQMTQVQYDDWLGGKMIQDALAHLSPDEREFLMTGITPQEWDEAFSEVD